MSFPLPKKDTGIGLGLFDAQFVGLLKKILVNGLTLSRIPLSIMFCNMISNGKDKLFTCATIFLVIALTDFFDGKLARFFGIESKIGAILDLGTDFFFILSSNYLLYKQGLIPLCMIILILIKFMEFCLTSYLMCKRLKIDKSLFFDKIGRFAAIMLYSIPLLTVILYSYIPKTIFDNLMLFIYVIIASLSTISLFTRATKLRKYKANM